MTFFPPSHASNFRLRVSPLIKLRSNFKWSSHEKHRFMTQTGIFFYEFSSHRKPASRFQNVMTRWQWVSSVKCRVDKFLQTQVRWQKDDILPVSAAAIKKRTAIQYRQTTTLTLWQQDQISHAMISNDESEISIPLNCRLFTIIACATTFTLNWIASSWTSWKLKLCIHADPIDDCNCCTLLPSSSLFCVILL